MGTSTVATDATFNTEVLHSKVPVIVDFWADWCAPCNRLSPVLEQLAGEHADTVKLVKVNVDENPDLATRYRITSIPSVYLFQDGQQKATVLGAHPKHYFEKEFADYLG